MDEIYDETRTAVLAAVLPEAAFATAKVDADMALLAFPKGVEDVVSFYSAEGDKQMLDELPAPDDMRIRERIGKAMMVRLAADAPHRAAAARAAAFLAVPWRQKLATQLLFETSNQIWRWAGDSATDFNYYSKRLILSGVLASTRLVWLDDDSEDFAATQEFLDRRIANVMQFEKLKARFNDAPDFSEKILKTFAEMRYPETG